MMIIDFDTDGITMRCPQKGLAFFDECLDCPFYCDYSAFQVYCTYRGFSDDTTDVSAGVEAVRQP